MLKGVKNNLLKKGWTKNYNKITNKITIKIIIKIIIKITIKFTCRWVEVLVQPFPKRLRFWFNLFSKGC
jgi:hypothetical protein